MFGDPANLHHPHYQANRSVLGGIMIKAALCMVLIIRRTLPEWQFAAMVVAFLLVVVVGASRVYLQVHFPSDVLGGVAFGIAWVALVYKVL